MSVGAGGNIQAHAAAGVQAVRECSNHNQRDRASAQDQKGRFDLSGLGVDEGKVPQIWKAVLAV
jgi:hypothetical protein